MITITLTGESLHAIKEQMTEFLVDTQVQITGPSVQELVAIADHPRLTEELQAEIDAVPSKEPDAKPFNLEVQKKRTRRTKEQIEADKSAKTGGNDVFTNGAAAPAEKPAPTSAAPIATPTTVAPVSAPAGYSKQHVHEALQQVNVAVGLPKSREILTSFGANRISEIKEEQFKAFVDKCNEVVMLQG